MNPATLGKAIFVTVVCDIMLPAVLAITHTLTTYYIFSGLAMKGLSYKQPRRIVTSCFRAP